MTTGVCPLHRRCWQPPNDNDNEDDIVLWSCHVVTPSCPLVARVAFRGVIHKMKSDYE